MAEKKDFFTVNWVPTKEFSDRNVQKNKKAVCGGQNTTLYLVVFVLNGEFRKWNQSDEKGEEKGEGSSFASFSTVPAGPQHQSLLPTTIASNL